MADPYNAKDVIIEYIRENEGLDVYLTDVDFSNPTRAEPTSDPENPGDTILPLRNTFVKITPKTVSGLYGVKTFHFNRIHISEVGVIEVEKGAATTHAGLLPAINTKYGLYLMPDDIVDQILNPALTGLITVVLQINPNSLTFYDGAVIATFE